MACLRKETCDLFPLISFNDALKIWQDFYCDGNFQSCKRYQLGLQGKLIPASLLPNGRILDLDGKNKSISRNKDTKEDKAEIETQPQKPDEI